jgi:hypothetical protein
MIEGGIHVLRQNFITPFLPRTLSIDFTMAHHSTELLPQVVSAFVQACASCQAARTTSQVDAEACDKEEPFRKLLRCKLVSQS